MNPLWTENKSCFNVDFIVNILGGDKVSWKSFRKYRKKPEQTLLC